MKLNIEIKKYKIKPKTQFIKIYCFGFENLDLLSKFIFCLKNPEKEILTVLYYEFFLN
jgi:hypothetical protein